MSSINHNPNTFRMEQDSLDFLKGLSTGQRAPTHQLSDERDIRAVCASPRPPGTAPAGTSRKAAAAAAAANNTKQSLLHGGVDVVPTSGHPIRKHLLGAPENYAKIVDIFHGHSGELKRESLIPFGLLQDCQQKNVQISEWLGKAQVRIGELEDEVKKEKKLREVLDVRSNKLDVEVARLQTYSTDLLSENRALTKAKDLAQTENTRLVKERKEIEQMFTKMDMQLHEERTANAKAQLEAQEDRDHAERCYRESLEARKMVEIFDARVMTAEDSLVELQAQLDRARDEVNSLRSAAKQKDPFFAGLMAGFGGGGGGGGGHGDGAGAGGDFEELMSSFAGGRRRSQSMKLPKFSRLMSMAGQVANAVAEMESGGRGYDDDDDDEEDNGEDAPNQPLRRHDSSTHRQMITEKKKLLDTIRGKDHHIKILDLMVQARTNQLRWTNMRFGKLVSSQERDRMAYAEQDSNNYNKIVVPTIDHLPNAFAEVNNAGDVRASEETRSKIPISPDSPFYDYFLRFYETVGRCAEAQFEILAMFDHFRDTLSLATQLNEMREMWQERGDAWRTLIKTWANKAETALLTVLHNFAKSESTLIALVRSELLKSYKPIVPVADVATEIHRELLFTDSQCQHGPAFFVDRKDAATNTLISGDIRSVNVTYGEAGCGTDFDESNIPLWICRLPYAPSELAMKNGVLYEELPVWLLRHHDRFLDLGKMIRTHLRITTVVEDGADDIRRPNTDVAIGEIYNILMLDLEMMDALRLLFTDRSHGTQKMMAIRRSQVNARLERLLADPDVDISKLPFAQRQEIAEYKSQKKQREARTRYIVDQYEDEEKAKKQWDEYHQQYQTALSQHQAATASNVPVAHQARKANPVAPGARIGLKKNPRTSSSKKASHSPPKTTATSKPGSVAVSPATTLTRIDLTTKTAGTVAIDMSTTASPPTSLLPKIKLGTPTLPKKKAHVVVDVQRQETTEMGDRTKTTDNVNGADGAPTALRRDDVPVAPSSVSSFPTL